MKINVCAFDEYIREIQTAQVKLTSQLQPSLTFNGIGSVTEYEKILWQKEMEYLEEYVTRMASPGQEHWKVIYNRYLNISSNYLSIDPDHTFQHTQLKITSDGMEEITQLPAPVSDLIGEFISQQYHSLDRVRHCIPDTSPPFYLPFMWNGKTVELIEYLMYPLIAKKIIPTEKNATQLQWIEAIFGLLKKSVPKHLYQTLHKLLLRKDCFRFMHSLEKEIRQTQESDS